MSALLDVCFLLACGWQSHARHAEARRWLETQSSFSTCPLSQLGFLRVSVSPAYRASWEDAQTVLQELLNLPGAKFVADDVPTKLLPVLSNSQEVTDAYFVALAKAHHLKLATLDDALCKKPWAGKVALNPLPQGRA